MIVERRLLELQVLTLTVLYQMVPLTVRVFKIQQYTKIDIPNSVKVALGIGHWALGIGHCALGSYYLAVTQAKHCNVFRMPKCPMPNCQ